jgi:hypothetical protein
MVILAAAALLVGAISWSWGALMLPGRAIVRGHVGDVAAVALVHAVIGLAGARPFTCAALTTLVALAIELTQPGRSRGAVGDLVLGSHFDPWDLIAYAIGIALAVVWDHRAQGGRSQPIAAPA